MMNHLPQVGKSAIPGQSVTKSSTSEVRNRLEFFQGMFDVVLQLWLKGDVQKKILPGEVEYPECETAPL